MSFDSIIRSAGTTVTIKRLSTAVGAGAQLTKTWTPRYTNIPARFNARPTRQEILYFEKEKVFAEFIVYMAYRTGIVTSDRLYFGTREFYIKHIANWDEQGRFLRLALEEVKE